MAVTAGIVVTVFSLVSASCGTGTPKKVINKPGGSTVGASVVIRAVNDTLRQSNADIYQTISFGGSASSTYPTSTIQGSIDFSVPAANLSAGNSASSSASGSMIYTLSDDYSSIPSVLSSSFPGKSWAVLSDSSASNHSAFVGSIPYNPVLVLEAMKGISGNFLSSASSAVGLPATKYSGGLNFADVSKVLGGSQGTAFVDLAAYLGVSHIPVSVWVDRSTGLIDEIQLTVTFPSHEISKTNPPVYIGLQFRNYGSAGSVILPSSGQVIKYSQMLPAIQAYQKAHPTSTTSTTSPPASTSTASGGGSSGSSGASPIP